MAKKNSFARLGAGQAQQRQDSDYKAFSLRYDVAARRLR
jgi:hypothetical protein